MAKKTKAKKKKEIDKPKTNKKDNNDTKLKITTNLDPKLSVDKYFSDRKNYHICKETKTKDSASYLSSTLNYTDNKSNKFYTIQLLEHDTQKKKLVLFSRWGKIDSKGTQEIKKVDFNKGYKLFTKKCQEKLKKGYHEVDIEPESDAQSDINSENANITGDKVRKVLEVIKKLSKTEGYKIIPENTNPNITDSKIGGLPYWPKNKEYPTSEAEEKLVLLIQINFDKEKVEYPLPKEGMLQFFLPPNDNLHGANLKDEDLTIQKNFRIIYHDKIDYSITKDQIEKLKLPTHEDDGLNFPVIKESKITLNKIEDYITKEDFRFDNCFAKAYKEVYKKNKPKDLDIYEFLGEDDDDYDNLLEPDENNHKILGYPYFVQEDPRKDDYYEYEVYDTVLLQLDSQDDLLMWGDVGAASFLIQKNDLIQKKFDDVLYNWDCH